MDRSVEKLLYSRRDTAEALSLSIRSIDYLITTGRLTARRVEERFLFRPVLSGVSRGKTTLIQSAPACPSSSVRSQEIGQHSSDESTEPLPAAK